MLRPKEVDKESCIIPFTTLNISIRINNSIISDQRNVAEVFGDYISTMANEIGGQHVLQLVEEDFNTHVSVEAIHHSHQSSLWIQQEDRLSCSQRRVREAKHP